jgi:hypothetical protein
LAVAFALPLLGLVMFLFLLAWQAFVVSKVGLAAVGEFFRELRGFLITPLLAYAIAEGLVICYGAPVYALLSQRRLANWLSVALVGVVPGVAVVLIGISSDRPLRATGVGLLLLVYGLFVALTTHAMMVRARSMSSAITAADLRTASSSMYRQWSRVLALTAIFGSQLTSWQVRHSTTGIGSLYGTVELIAPFVLAAFACLLRAHFLSSKPRSIGPLAEASAVLVLGAMLSIRTFGVL